jgi:2-polyprenyl-6-hydroxyphenyl methylase/3-demethylubiquinone-9 3-methyltransferase
MTKTIHNKLIKLLENTGDMALKRRARRIVEEIDPRDGDDILEVGCGDGFYLHLLSNLGIKLKLSGVDIDPNALRSAKRNLKNKKVLLKQADLMKKLPFKNESFNKVIMSEVAEHLPDDVRGLKEVKRVLGSGGILVLTVPNTNYPFLWDPINWVLEHFFRTHIKSGFWAGLWNQHIRLYKPEEIKRSVLRAGFRVEKIESLTWWCLPFNHNLMNLAARNLYGGNLSPRMVKTISKYEKNIKRPLLVNFVFGIVNLVDRFNDIYQPEKNGVGVLVKSSK